jgi:membrane-bound serine protease (ClpP class)
MLPLILLLLFIGLFLLVIEAFVPGGVVGTVGVLLIIASGILFVRDYGWDAGLGYFAASTVIGFATWLAGFLLIARRLALTPHKPKTTPRENDPRIGASGRVVKTLRPTGEIEIDGRRCAARSDLSNAEIPPGTEVVVIDVDGSYLVVEPREEAGSPLDSSHQNV